MERFRDKTSPFTIKNVVLDFMLENKTYMYAYLVLSFVVPITTIYLPHLYGKLVSHINTTKTIDVDAKKQFAFIIMVWLFVNLVWVALSKVNSSFLPRLRSHVRTHVVDRVIDAYTENYSEDELGGLMANLVRLPDEVDKFFFSVVEKVLPVVYTIVGAVIYFLIVNPVLGTVGAASIGALSWYTYASVQRCAPKQTEVNEAHERLYSKINDSLGNLLNVYTSNRNSHEKNELELEQEAYTLRQQESADCSSSFLVQTNVSYLLLFAGLNALSFWLFSKGRLQLSSVISVLIVSLELISKMVTAVGTVNKLMVETSLIRHVQTSLDALEERRRTTPQHPKQENKEWSAKDADITFENVRLVHAPIAVAETTPVEPGGGVAAGSTPVVSLDDVSLELRGGSTTVLVGHIGSGKTSLINSLVRLTPYEGQIRIGGVDIKTLPLEQLRDQVLYVPQNPRLFDRTVYENIAYGNDTPREEVEKALRDYDIKFDLDKRVGKFGQKMSGGQRQMIFLLRTLFKSAPIVVMDEPTASLDYTTRQDVMKLLQRLLETRTVIIVSHDADVLKYADTVVTMSAGKVQKVEKG